MHAWLLHNDALKLWGDQGNNLLPTPTWTADSDSDSESEAQLFTALAVITGSLIAPSSIPQAVR
jgi:hypothetical protein